MYPFQADGGFKGEPAPLQRGEDAVKCFDLTGEAEFGVGVGELSELFNKCVRRNTSNAAGTLLGASEPSTPW